MQTKTWVIITGLMLLAVIVLFVSGGDEDPAIVDQLARRQTESERPVSSGSTADQRQRDIFKLTPVLTAEREGDQDTWLVRNGRRNTFVELPFRPTDRGVLPEADSGGGSPELPSANPGFLGAAACAECHRERHDGFIHTAHHKTSGVVSADTALGNFAEPSNLLSTSDPKLSFEMQRRGDQCFQNVRLADWSLTFPFDVFTGSAKAGQTYLYWHRDALFQNHVSYLSRFEQWIPSPGYRDTTVYYSRPIRLDCLECHITYIQRRQKPNVYDRDSVVWGISCERCHGPGREHVAYHRNHPQEKTARHIIHPTDLPRRGQLQICGQCHSGSFSLLGDAFSYRPGDPLEKHHKLLDPDFEGVGGIHTSNQLTRLSMSKCFQESSMTCTSCHDPHQNQRGDTAVFTERCLSCHQPQHCGMSNQLGDKAAENCVDCHMPKGDVERMTMQVAGGSFTMTMIDHYIRVDRKATKAYLDRQQRQAAR